MHRVKELEKKWFNYKVKQMMKPTLRWSLFSLLIGGAYYAYESKAISFASLPLGDKVTNVLGVSLERNNSIEENSSLLPKEELKTVTPSAIKIEEVKAVEALALAPIIPVIDMEKEERRVERTKRVTAKKSSNVVRAKPNAYLTAKELAVISQNQKRVASVPHKTKKMKFQTTSVNYIETIKAKFLKSKNPREALILANSYYKNAEYTKAEKWALSANKLDNSLEDSWLLFAKSKAKLGKKKEALTVLVSYYKKSQSIKAKRVIGQIKTGKL